jgi:uncharacterized protein YggE
MLYTGTVTLCIFHMSDEVTKRIMVLVWLLLAFAALGYVYQYGRSIKQTYPARSFSVDGDAKMTLIPDIATFSVSVVSEGNRVPDVQKMNTEKMNAVQAFLKESGVDKKDLQTTQYSLNPRYDYPICDGTGKCPAPRISGYTLVQELTVKVRDTEKLGDMLSGVTDKGANTVSSVTFSVDDEKEARNAAREEAIAEAKKKARDMAKAGGFGVGRLISLYEDQGNFPQPMYGGRGGGVMADSSKASAEVAPSIEPGTQDSTVRVTLTFEIAD